MPLANTTTTITRGVSSLMLASPAASSHKKQREPKSPLGSIISASPDVRQDLVMKSAMAGFPPRRRLDTADTPIIRNVMAMDSGGGDDYIKTPPPPPPLTKRAVFENKEDDDHDDDDCSSVVSSLSNDDSILRPPAENTSTEFVGLSLPPPKEVIIPEAGDPSVPQWLRHMPTSSISADESRSLRTSSTPASKVKASSLIPRPSFGRHKSCPQPPMDFSTTRSTTSSSKATLQSSIYSASMQSSNLSSIVVNGKIVTDVSYRSGMTDPFVAQQQQQQQHAKLLGQRPRRHVRSQSLASASVGSMSLTAPTATSTISSMSMASRVQQKLNSLTGADDGMACCRSRHEAEYRTKNVVQREFKYVLNRMSSPIKRISKRAAGGSSDNVQDVNLERANGCLT